MKNVKDIGETRREILRYASDKGFEWVFMFDDDISKVETLGQREDGSYTANRIINGSITSPEFENKALMLWYKTAKKHCLSLSSPNHRAYDRHNHGPNIRINRSAIIQAVLINVKDAIEVGNYKSISVTGNEDYYLQYLIMQAGKLTGKIGLIEYDCPTVGAGKGGNNEAEGNSLEERYEKYIQTFQTYVCDNEELVTTKITSTGVPSLKFVWKNWGGYTLNLEGYYD